VAPFSSPHLHCRHCATFMALFFTAAILVNLARDLLPQKYARWVGGRARRSYGVGGQTVQQHHVLCSYTGRIRHCGKRSG
jgi:hypothetical protein